MTRITDSLIKLLKLDNLFGSLSGYVETRLQLYKIELREDVGRALSQALVYAVLGFFAFLFLIFFSIGLAHFINSFFEATYTGYWIVAGIYGLFFLVIILYKKTIDASFEKRFIELFKPREK